MKAAITQLQIHLDVLTTNEPINRAEGNTEQADLEATNAAEIRQAIAVLERAPLVVDRIQEVLKASPSSGPLWHGSTAISGLREALAVLPSCEAVEEDTPESRLKKTCLHFLRLGKHPDAVAAVYHELTGEEMPASYLEVVPADPFQ